MIKENIYIVDIGYAYFGLIEKQGVVIKAPPIAKWCINKSIRRIIQYYSKKGKIWEYEKIL